ncbi:hypothetical protein [Spirulina sp. 06S082]|uniref:hypothetical protein n=1 Tax=Spirulina sp. 06S082 TaxID=3110248 RepID=UPI002B214FBA|nr:hypothetical protein [Spirulina sp. 06S082]MEA5468436.1 hypothetical protein [Spirulina sp. 06S082]
MPAIALLALIFVLNLFFEFIGIFLPLDLLHLLSFAGKWCGIVAIALIVGWCFGD